MAAPFGGFCDLCCGHNRAKVAGRFFSREPGFLLVHYIQNKFWIRHPTSPIRAFRISSFCISFSISFSLASGVLFSRAWVCRLFPPGPGAEYPATRFPLCAQAPQWRRLSPRSESRLSCLVTCVGFRGFLISTRCSTHSPHAFLNLSEIKFSGNTPSRGLGVSPPFPSFLFPSLPFPSTPLCRVNLPPCREILPTPRQILPLRM